MEKARQSNFEVLRIFAMFLIILHHLIMHGIFPYISEPTTPLETINTYSAIFLASGGKIGVTLFIFLTGYFSCSQNFSLTKFFYIYCKTLFFSALILLTFIFFGFYINYDTKLQYLFPVMNNTYWFITTWLLLYCLSPLLNLILRHADNKQLRLYLLLMTILWVLFPPFQMANRDYSLLLYFIYLYFLSASIRLNIIKINPALMTAIFLVSLIYNVLNIYISSQANHLVQQQAIRLQWCHTLYVLSASLCLFYFTTNMRIKNSDFINYISKAMLGVYLLHDNPLTRKYLWYNLFEVHQLINTQYFTCIILGTTCFTFIICITIEKCVSFCLNKTIQRTSEFLASIAERSYQQSPQPK